MTSHLIAYLTDLLVKRGVDSRNFVSQCFEGNLNDLDFTLRTKS